MANSKYTRPASGFRFLPGGIKTTSPPDGLKEDEYSYLQNLRWTLENAPQSRPQLVQAIAAPVSGGGPVLTLEPSLGLYKIGPEIFSGGIAIDSGYSNNSASMTPFRPAESPVAWEYVWDSVQARKILPSGPTAQKTGIAEPPFPAEAFLESPLEAVVDQATGYTAGGTAGTIGTGTRFTDVAGISFIDPAYVATAPSFPVIGPMSSVLVSGTDYQRDQTISIAGTGITKIIDVIPPLAGGLAIQSIFYYAGTTGRCSIGLSIGLSDDIQSATMSSLRRGAIINIGTETVYLLSAVKGPSPSGSIALEAITGTTHTTAESVTMTQPTIVIAAAPVTPGSAITAVYAQSGIGTGIGTLTNTYPYNPFATTLPFSPAMMFGSEDYLHFSVWVQYLENLNELKLLLDVSDGTFTKDYYYYAVRPSDIAAGVTNRLTQLGVTQLAGQRQIISEEAQAQGITASSGETNPADGVWSEITFPISQLQRVGSDQTKSLNTFSGAFQYLFNTSNVSAGNTSVEVTFPSVFGGYRPDIGISLNGYKFRYRGRSSITGAKSNGSPEMRYALRPSRQAIVVTMPAGIYDPQIDTWDIFVFGGELDSYRFAGSVPAPTFGATLFGYNMGDEQVAGAEVLEEDNYEPFPTVDVPFNATASFIGGTVLTVTTAATNILRYLPGNVITAGQYQYTLRQRPTLIAGSSYLLQTVESISSVGLGSRPGPISIYEPEIAAQPLPYVWGPDNNGTLFGCGDTLRPDFIYTTKANAPDSCPDRNKEISVPTDPLVNGCLLDQTSFVASPSRWWRGYPRSSGAYTDYDWVEIPVGEGLAAPRGICSDGKAIYFVGHTGINATSGGAAKSLTEAALRNLFPHEDVPGVNVIRAGQTIYAPDYRWAADMRLAACNGYLYFDYSDSGRNPRTLVLDLTRGGFASIDVYAAAAIVTRGVLTLPDSPTPGTRISRMYMGDTTGAISVESPSAPGAGESVACVLVTRGEIAGDLRAAKQWGDAALIAMTGAAVSAYPVVNDYVGALALTTVASSVQVTNIVSLGGGVLAQSLGLMLTWTDRGTVTIPYSWQPSYISKPEIVTNRSSDWMDAGSIGNKFWQGFRITVDTFGVAKQFTVYDETGTAQQTFTITTSGEVTQAFSFAVPFYSYMVMVKSDSGSCREFGINWVTQPAPSTVLQWITQPTAHGQQGWQHVKQLMMAHRSTADLTLTVYVDNVALTAVTITNSGGVYRKTLVILPPNKGLVYSYSVTSSQGFQLWEEDLEIWQKAWPSVSAYNNMKLLGASLGPRAEI